MVYTVYALPNAQPTVSLKAHCSHYSVQQTTLATCRTTYMLTATATATFKPGFHYPS